MRINYPLFIKLPPMISSRSFVRLVAELSISTSSLRRSWLEDTFSRSFNETFTCDKFFSFPSEASQASLRRKKKGD